MPELHLSRRMKRAAFLLRKPSLIKDVHKVMENRSKLSMWKDAEIDYCEKKSVAVCL